MVRVIHFLTAVCMIVPALTPSIRGLYAAQIVLQDSSMLASFSSRTGAHTRL